MYEKIFTLLIITFVKLSYIINNISFCIEWRQKYKKQKFVAMSLLVASMILGLVANSKNGIYRQQMSFCLFMMQWKQ